MRIGFTLCSNNYLSQAKVLADSFCRHNPGYKFIIGLVDKKSDLIDYSFFLPHDIITVEEIGVEDFEGLCQKFDIIELNTCVKPFYFKYLQSRFDAAEVIYYFDPDIKIYRSIDKITDELTSSSLVLTPHIFNPIELDDLFPQETLFLNYGIYNLGFIGINVKHKEALRFLTWWSERTYKLGYNRSQYGLFVDQLWINLVPLFFKGVTILKDYGLNMAPWNLHERSIENMIDISAPTLSNGDVLTFYHFSSYDYRQPEKLSTYYNRYQFADTGELKELYHQYHQDLLDNHIDQFINIPWAYFKPKEKSASGFLPRLKRKIKKIFF